jgi:hypothetical protein
MSMTIEQLVAGPAVSVESVVALVIVPLNGIDM